MPLDAGTVQVDVQPDLRGFGTKLAAGVNGAVAQVEKGLSSKLKSLGSQLNTVGNQLTKGVTLPIIGIGAVAVKSAIDFETSFTGVRKTVQATEAQLAKLSAGLRDMSKATGTNVNELNAIAEAAGALGVKTDDILGFVDVVNKLAVSTDLTADAAATALGKLQNVLGLTSKDYERFAAALVDLGNTGASTESEVVEMALRIAGTGKTVGLTTAEILAFSAAAADAGIAAERGGTDISKTFQDISVAVAEGGKDLAGFAKVARTTAPAFAKLFGRDPAKATAAFIDGLREIRKQAGPGGVILALKELGITESRQIDTLQLLANAQSGVNEKIGQSAKAYKDATAAQIEFDKKQETTERKLARIKASLTDTFITLGERLIPVLEKNLPTIERIGDAIADMVEAFGNLDPKTQERIVKGFLLFAAAGPIIKGLGGITSLLGNLGGLFKTVGIAAGRAGGAKGVGGLLANMKGLQAIGNVTLTVGIAVIGKKTLDGILGFVDRVKEQGAANTLLPSWTDEGKHAAATLDTLTGKFGKLADAMKLSNEERFKVIGALSRESEANVKAADRINKSWGLIEAAVRGGADVPKLIAAIGEGADAAAVKAQLLAGKFGGSASKIKAALNDVAVAAQEAATSFETSSGDMVSAWGTAAGNLELHIRDVNGELKRMIPLNLADLGKKQFIEMAKSLDIPLDAAERLRTRLQLIAAGKYNVDVNVRVNTIHTNPSGGYVIPGLEGGALHAGGLVFHEGGYIPSMHRGGLRRDERLIKAQAGEFMMQRSAVRRIGVENLEKLNAGEALSEGTRTVVVPVNIDGREVARLIAPFNDRELEGRRRAMA